MEIQNGNMYRTTKGRETQGMSSFCKDGIKIVGLYWLENNMSYTKQQPTIFKA